MLPHKKARVTHFRWRTEKKNVQSTGKKHGRCVVLYNLCNLQYHKESFLYSNENQAVVGKLMRKEEKGEITTEYLGLGSKLHSLTVQGTKD